jgi:ribose 5-phosphate isomerase B
MKVAVGADHAGYQLKERVKQYLERHGHTVLDMGTNSTESTDYPQYAFRVAEAVRDGLADRGVLVCDTGTGSRRSRGRGIRAALCLRPHHAEMSRRHKTQTSCAGSAILPKRRRFPPDAWFSAPFDGGRHARRMARSRLRADTRAPVDRDPHEEIRL